MKRKRHGGDEIIRKLRKGEAMEASGTSSTLARWRKRFRWMEDHQINIPGPRTDHNCLRTNPRKPRR